MAGLLHSSEAEHSPKLRAKARWQFKLLAACVPLVVLVTIDVALRVVGWLPPEDPLLFHVKTYEQDFSPFVETVDGYLTIKPDWVNHGDIISVRRGTRLGRYFLFPGFRPCRIAKKKSPKAVRIFVLGGSTTFGLGVGAESAFASVMERRLSESVKDCELTVVNLGCPGMASLRINNLLDTVLRLSPDLVIIYSGHNEMVDSCGTDSPTLDSVSYLRRSLLSISTTFRWLNYAISSLRHSQEYDIVTEEAAALRAGQMLFYDPLFIPADQRSLPSEEFLSSVTSRYSANVRAMISKAQAARVPILFVLPIANLLIPPVISVHDNAFDQLEVFESCEENAWQALQQGRLAEALQDLGRAVRLSPGHARVRYLRGRTLLRLGRQEQALGAFQSACDLDAGIQRITSRLESAMIKAVDGSGAKWVDLRPLFRKDISIASAQKLFVDHCHPTKYGHRLIAERIMPTVIASLRIDSRS
jgi:lysophospholipase L1-like esterase